MFSVLNKPYPKGSTNQRKVIFSLVFGLFIFAFLVVLQPFELSQWETPHKTLKLLGYGVITTLVILINSFIIENIFRSWFSEENWKVWKEIIWAIWSILVIGTCNLYYSHWLTLFPINFQTFINFQLITLIIGAFPITIITLVNHGRLQKKNLTNAQQMTQIIEQDTQIEKQEAPTTKLNLPSENGKEELSLFPDELLVIVSADNYVEVYFMQGEVVKKELLRNTLKNLEHLITPSPNMFRCHRSYLVNLKRVDKVEGNSQGYKLHLPVLDFLVPVSRSLNEIIRQKIAEIHSIHP